MKVLYHIGETIGKETIVKKGFLKEDARPIVIESEEGKVFLDHLTYVGFFRMDGLGTMIKLQNGPDTIYLTVPRFYLEIGTGLAVVNYFATKKLKRFLDSVLEGME